MVEMVNEIGSNHGECDQDCRLAVYDGEGISNKCFGPIKPKTSWIPRDRELIKECVSSPRLFLRTRNDALDYLTSPSLMETGVLGLLIVK